MKWREGVSFPWREGVNLRGFSKLIQEWRSQIDALPSDEKKEGEKSIRFAPKKDGVNLTPQDCIDYTLGHSFERSSVMRDRKLLAQAFRFSLGHSVSTAGIADAFRADKRIIQVTEYGETLCTTRSVLKEEQEMVALAKAGQGKLIPLYQEAPKINLEGQQAAAIADVLTTANRFSIIRGAAGAGKTTLMKELKSHIEKAGKQVIAVAPSASASRGVLREEGFANAQTGARLILDEKMQQDLKGQVLLVDEAGLLGTQDMTSLLKIAIKQNAQVVFVGDTRQHASVVRGDALRILNKVADIKTAEVSKIYRQSNEQYKAAVEDLSKGKVSDGFKKLDEIGFIKSIDTLQINKALVDDYMIALKNKKGALIISPTHAQGEAVTDAIRERMKRENLLGKKEVNVTKFTNLNLTDAQKKDLRNFKEGQVIQFNQNAPGIQRGSIWRVHKTEKDIVQIKDKEGNLKTLPHQLSKRYEVYIENSLKLSKGDKVRITRGGFDNNKKRLENDDVLNVLKVSKNGKVLLQNSKSKVLYEINKDFGNIAHAHCITSYNSQGKNIDEVFICQPSGTFGATDAKQFYVSVSRGKERAHIYTDDKEALLEHAKHMGERQSAIELTNRKQSKFYDQYQILDRNALRSENNIINPKQNRGYEPEI